jgi:hypothetical protein
MSANALRHRNHRERVARHGTEAEIGAKQVIGNREEWLLAGVAELAPFMPAEIPPVQISVERSVRSWVGRCFIPNEQSPVAHVFVGADVTDPATVLEIVHHELCHAVLGRAIGPHLHGKPFRDLLKASKPGEGYQAIAERLGDYPHVPQRKPPARPRTFKIRYNCPACGYTVEFNEFYLEVLNETGEGVRCPIHHRSVMAEPRRWWGKPCEECARPGHQNIICDCACHE